MGTIATEKLYNIMDYSYNYYMVNTKDQLVVARNENDATIFTFAEANRRIGAGPKSRFYFMAPAENTNEEVDEEDEPSDVDENDISIAKELTEAEIPEEINKSMAEYDLSKMDWQEYLTHFAYVISELSGYREDLIKAESDVDKKICDVLHYIELCDTSEAEAADLIELLRVCRENRREIKDQILIVEAFQRNLGTASNVAKAKETIKALEGLETRKYKPRKFSELFEGSKVKTHKKTESTVKNSPAIADNKVVELESTKEEITMDYTRKETAFDGKTNDWMAFAIQQAEFYKNAGQYIINLKISMDEIDNTIAELMDEIEEANCNVAQGYKMFKRLKDLRLERKQLERELECLNILTGSFDMRSMADICNRNIQDLEGYLFGKSSEQDCDKVQVLFSAS